MLIHNKNLLNKFLLQSNKIMSIKLLSCGATHFWHVISRNRDVPWPILLLDLTKCDLLLWGLLEIKGLQPKFCVPLRSWRHGFKTKLNQFRLIILSGQCRTWRPDSKTASPKEYSSWFTLFFKINVKIVTQHLRTYFNLLS